MVVDGVVEPAGKIWVEVELCLLVRGEGAQFVDPSCDGVRVGAGGLVTERTDESPAAAGLAAMEPADPSMKDRDGAAQVSSGVE